MSIVSDALQILDDARALLDDVGLRPYTVSVRVTRWIGGQRVGDGAPLTTVTPLTVASGRRPKVRQLSSKQIVAQGGAMDDEVYEVGPFTPVYTGGGMPETQIDPSVGADPQEVQYIIIGPGTPSSGALCEKISDKLDSPFRMMITLRKTGVAA